jgi:hypothetical protein
VENVTSEDIEDIREAILTNRATMNDVFIEHSRD